MRLTDSLKTRTGARVLVTIFVAYGLAGCASIGSTDVPNVAGVPANGPQADYPILVGEPYQIAGKQYTPADVLNYDEVGYLTLDPDTTGYSGAHHTLPVPSYAEVTSLESGRTVLVRLERRGPMSTNHLVALSPAAMAQLGGSVETPVRVRRVNPPELQRAMLRAGEAAPLRMDTPSSLLTVLQRRLPDSGSASLVANAELSSEIETIALAASTASAAASEMVELTPAEPARSTEGGELAATQAASVEHAEKENSHFAAAFQTGENVAVQQAAEPAPIETSEPPATEVATSPETEGGFVVQAAAFANADNARRAAESLGGAVSQSGRYYRVRTGPFPTRGEAEASLANVQSEGYSDARILTSG